MSTYLEDFSVLGLKKQLMLVLWLVVQWMDLPLLAVGRKQEQWVEVVWSPEGYARCVALGLASCGL